MAAIAFTGEPLAMKAMPGPEPSATSILSAAIACCSLASPAKAVACTSRPSFLKMPSWMPTSSGTKENASGTALPTRNSVVGVAGAEAPNAAADGDER